jgi:hypothetical protein
MIGQKTSNSFLSFTLDIHTRGLGGCLQPTGVLRPTRLLGQLQQHQQPPQQHPGDGRPRNRRTAVQRLYDQPVAAQELFARVIKS